MQSVSSTRRHQIKEFLKKIKKNCLLKYSLNGFPPQKSLGEGMCVTFVHLNNISGFHPESSWIRSLWKIIFPDTLRLPSWVSSGEQPTSFIVYIIVDHLLTYSFAKHNSSPRVPARIAIWRSLHFVSFCFAASQDTAVLLCPPTATAAKPFTLQFHNNSNKRTLYTFFSATKWWPIKTLHVSNTSKHGNQKATTF